MAHAMIGSNVAARSTRAAERGDAMDVKTVALSWAHMETRSLEDTAAVLTDLLAFERIGEAPDGIVLKHPNTPWVMTVHDGGADAREKASGNHYGVRVVVKEE